MYFLKLILKYLNFFRYKFIYTFESHLHLEEREGIKQKLISIYRDLQKFLQSEVYTKELQNELQQSNPDYLKVLEKRIRDMEKSDHGIVIAGKVAKKTLNT